MWNMFKVNNKDTPERCYLVSLLLILNKFHTFFYCFYYDLYTFLTTENILSAAKWCKKKIWTQFPLK